MLLPKVTSKLRQRTSLFQRTFSSTSLANTYIPYIPYDAMASFDDYLREVRLSVEQFDNMSLEMKEVERGRFISSF